MTERRQRSTPDEHQRLHTHYETLRQANVADLQRLAVLKGLEFERDLSDEEMQERLVLEPRVAAREPRLEAAQRAADLARRSLDVAAVEDEWSYAEKQQAYADFFQAIALARVALGTIQSITAQQCAALASAGVSASEVNLDATGVLSNIASRQPAAQAWSLLLSNPSGPLPTGLIEDAMDPDIGCRPLAPKVFRTVLGPVA